MPTIRLPKQFVSFLSGSSVVAGEDTGYEGGPAVLAAWHDGYSHGDGTLTLTFTDADWPDALDCLDDYADASQDSARDARSDYRSYESGYREYSAEIAAATKIRRRIAIERSLLPVRYVTG